MLTNKQRLFCEYYYSGLSAKDSYLKAYNTDNSTVASIESTKLLKRSDINEYINNTLNKPIVDNIQHNKETQIQFIKDRIEYCISCNDENNIVKYTDQLNKIYGIYKTDNSVDSKNNSVFNAISTDKLNELLN